MRFFDSVEIVVEMFGVLKKFRGDEDGLGVKEYRMQLWKRGNMDGDGGVVLGLNVHVPEAVVLILKRNGDIRDHVFAAVTLDCFQAIFGRNLAQKRLGIVTWTVEEVEIF